MKTADDPCLCAEVGPTAVVERRVADDWLIEADRHKWIESQRAGRDLGEDAIRQWIRQHWWGYLRARWLEHLHGSCFWIELDRGDFGILKRAFLDQQVLLKQILDHLKKGGENLDILRWACCNQIPLEPVIDILESLDVNGYRLINQFNGTCYELHRHS